MNNITILTATHNRSSKLKLLYESLLSQTNSSFNWLVIDDGSQDDTREVMKEFCASDKRVSYLFQTNGGKHRAINNSKDYVKTDLLFVVDSDDILEPEAIHIILEDWRLYKHSIVGITYLKRNHKGDLIGDCFSNNYLISTYEEERIFRKTKGDKAEVWKTSVFFSFPFLEFEFENFFSEQHKYLSISGEGKILFVNKSIYICEYLEDGLSSKIRYLQFLNPNGAIENAIILSKKEYPPLIRIKSFIQIFNFSILANKNFLKIISNQNFGIQYFFLIPLAFLYHLYFVFSANNKT